MEHIKFLNHELESTEALRQHAEDSPCLARFRSLSSLLEVDLAVLGIVKTMHFELRDRSAVGEIVELLQVRGNRGRCR